MGSKPSLRRRRDQVHHLDRSFCGHLGCCRGRNGRRLLDQDPKQVEASHSKSAYVTDFSFFTARRSLATRKKGSLEAKMGIESLLLIEIYISMDINSYKFM